MMISIGGRSVNRITGKSQTWTLPLRPLCKGQMKGVVRYRGRTALALRFRDGLESVCAGKARSTAVSYSNMLGFYWRFLDSQEKLSRSLPGVDALVLDDLEWPEVEALWRPFLDWLGTQPTKRKYEINLAVYLVISRAHSLATNVGGPGWSNLEIYVFYRSDPSARYGGDPLGLEEARGAFAVLATEWRRILKRVASGRALAAHGSDPRTGSSGARRWHGGTWNVLDNRLRAVMDVLPFGKLCQMGSIDSFRAGFKNMACDIAPACFGDEGTGLWSHVPAVFMNWRAIAVAFAMVCMKTGMNVDTVGRMRADSWTRRDPFNPDRRAIIYGPKRIVGQVSTASSSVSRPTDPYQILQTVIDLTTPLRDRAREVARATGDRALAEAAELIWIWPTSRGLGTLLPGKTVRTTMHEWLDALFEQRGLTRADGSPVRFRFSEGRDVFALFVFHRSGFDFLRTAQSLGHKGLDSLLAYIEKKAVRIADRIRLIDLQNKVLGALRNSRYDPRDFREEIPGLRTPSGLVCTKPEHPLPEADPGNPGGVLCRKKKCWVCTRWYAVVESLPYLLRIVTELHELREILPLASWEASDYVEMLAVYEHIVSKFHPSLVADARVTMAQVPPIIVTTRFVPGSAS